MGGTVGVFGSLQVVLEGEGHTRGQEAQGLDTQSVGHDRTGKKEDRLGQTCPGSVGEKSCS